MDRGQARTPSETEHLVGKEPIERPLEDLVPWRLPAWAQAAPPLLYFAIVALLRDATGAGASILTVLVLVPVFWYALYGARPQLLVSVAGVFLTLAAPALIVGAPDYPPEDELLRALLWLVIAGTLGIAVHRLVLEVRARFIEYRSILETAHESFIAAGPDGSIVDWNQQAERDFGWSRHEVIGRQLAATVIPPKFRGVYAAGFDHLLRFGDHTLLGRRFEMPAMRRDGEEFPVEITVSALPVDGGYRLNAFLHDISERRRSDRALREAEERFRRSFHDSAAGMAIVGTDGSWLQVNQALADLTGYARGELTGMSFADITHPEDVDAEAEALAQLVAGERRRYVTEKRYLRADGRLVWASLSLSPIRDEVGNTLYLISQMQDVTERKRTEARLAHQAMHDPLTGLPNRTLFTDRMELAKARLERGGSLALMFCDLDDFKEVNDSFGHEAGDRILIQVADRLRSIVRPSDTVSRFGGDEFALLCEGLQTGAAERIASRIAEAFSAPFAIDGREISLSASTGIVFTSDPEVDPDRLMGDADLAMYAAKQDGGARHAVFGGQMATDSRS